MLKDPEENMSDGKKETVSITTFKKWPFGNDFRIETEHGKVLSALCKYCSEVEYNDCMREGSALKSICFFARHVGLQSFKTCTQCKTSIPTKS